MFITKETKLEVSKINNYLKHKINNWYANTREDYNIYGLFKNIKTSSDLLEINWTEAGKDYTMSIAYYNDFTLEQLYNIWMSSDWQEVVK